MPLSLIPVIIQEKMEIKEAISNTFLFEFGVNTRPLKGWNSRKGLTMQDRGSNSYSNKL